METSCLSGSTRLPAVLGGIPTSRRFRGCPGALVPQSATEWQRLSQSAALRGEGCDRPGATRQSTIHDSFPSVRAGEATRPDSALSP